jgi:hypothetical protein
VAVKRIHRKEQKITDKADRDLQIKLAQLSIKIQIYLAAVFGFMSLGGGCLVGAFQLYSSVPKDKFSFELILLSGLSGLGIFAAVFGIYFIKLSSDCKSEIDSLK